MTLPLLILLGAAAAGGALMVAPGTRATGALMAFLAGLAALAMAIPSPQAPGGVAPDKEIERQSPLAVKTRLPQTAEEAKAKGTEIVSFGTGCFWCSEDDMRRTKGVLATEVGYQGGRTKNPTYKEVCTGKTGHVEVTRLEFDPKVVSFRTLVKRFFQIHDPTQGNRQGLDIGEQYRSVIFTTTPEQRKVAQEELAVAQKAISRRITTTIEPAPAFWRGEDYHQQYYQKQGYSRGV